MTYKLTNIIKDQRGTSAIEYGMICAMIVIGLVSAVRGVADENSGLWATIASKQKTATESAID